MIKRISIFTAMALLVSSLAFAADITMTATMASTTTGKSVYGLKGTGSATTSSPLIGKNSTGCGVGIKTAAQGYALVTQHLNGTKAFGTSFDSTAIISSDVTAKGTAFLTIPAGTDLATGFTATTWSSM
jgi:hypothetical protein